MGPDPSPKESEAIAARPNVSYQQLPNEIKQYTNGFFLILIFIFNFWWEKGGGKYRFSELVIITLVCGRDLLLKANKTFHMCMIGLCVRFFSFSFCLSLLYPPSNFTLLSEVLQLSK